MKFGEGEGWTWQLFGPLGLPFPLSPFNSPQTYGNAHAQVNSTAKTQQFCSQFSAVHSKIGGVVQMRFYGWCSMSKLRIAHSLPTTPSFLFSNCWWLVNQAWSCQLPCFSLSENSVSATNWQFNFRCRGTWLFPMTKPIITFSLNVLEGIGTVWYITSHPRLLT